MYDQTVCRDPKRNPKPVVLKICFPEKEKRSLHASDKENLCLLTFDVLISKAKGLHIYLTK